MTLSRQKNAPVVRESGSPDLGRPLDAMWLLGVDDGPVRFPVVSFSSSTSPLDGVVVLFFEGVRVSDEASDTWEFWAPWLGKAVQILEGLSGRRPQSQIDGIPAVLWQISGGRMPAGVSASPEAMRRRGKLYDRVCAAVFQVLEGLLDRASAKVRVLFDPGLAEMRHYRVRRPAPHVLRRGDPRLRLVRPGDGR